MAEAGKYIFLRKRKFFRFLFQKRSKARATEMIYDSLDQLSRYAKLAPGVWEKVETFLAGCSPEAPHGRHELDGDRVYALIQDYETHPANPDKLEIHNKYIDIQLLLAGEESILVRPVEDLETALSYDAGRDIAFYRLPAGDADAVAVTLVPGKFAVFFPEEGHMPGLNRGNAPCRVLKVVIKIAAAAMA